jgi:hypothetical protein
MNLDFNAAMKNNGEPRPPAEVVTEQPQAPAQVDPFDLTPVKKLFAKHDAQIAEFVEQATALEINNQDDNAKAVEMMGSITKLKKRIDTVRKEKTAPYFNFKKNVDGLAKGFTSRLDNVLKVLNPKVTAWQQEQERIRLEEERKAREEAARLAKEAEEEARKLQAAADAEAAATGQESVKVDAPVVAPPVVPKADAVTRTDAGAAHVRKTWAFEIEDPTKVPAEYLMVDERKVREAVKQGIREIPGVRIYEDAKTVIRTN